MCKGLSRNILRIRIICGFNDFGTNYFEGEPVGRTELEVRVKKAKESCGKAMGKNKVAGVTLKQLIEKA